MKLFIKLFRKVNNWLESRVPEEIAIWGTIGLGILIVLIAGCIIAFSFITGSPIAKTIPAFNLMISVIFTIITLCITARIAKRYSAKLPLKLVTEVRDKKLDSTKKDVTFMIDVTNTRNGSLIPQGVYLVITSGKEINDAGEDSYEAKYGRYEYDDFLGCQQCESGVCETVRNLIYGKMDVIQAEVKVFNGIDGFCIFTRIEELSPPSCKKIDLGETVHAEKQLALVPGEYQVVLLGVFEDGRCKKSITLLHV